jgi:hypothetical protein
VLDDGNVCPGKDRKHAGCCGLRRRATHNPQKRASPFAGSKFVVPSSAVIGDVTSSGVAGGARVGISKTGSGRKSDGSAAEL